MSINTPIAVLLLCLALLCPSLSQGEGDLKLGGWHEVPLSEQRSYSNAFSHLLSQASELSSGHKIIKVQMQVVAGFNYRFTLHTQEYGPIQAVIYQDLNGDFDLVYIQPIKSDL